MDIAAGYRSRDTACAITVQQESKCNVQVTSLRSLELLSINWDSEETSSFPPFFHHCLCPKKKEFFILRRAPGSPPSSHPQPQWTPERKTCTRLLGNQNQRNIPGWACSWSTAKTLKKRSTDRVVIITYVSIRLQLLHISEVFFLAFYALNQSSR